MAEHVVIAGECESNRAYHCMPQYGITEVDPQTGEIAGTGFLNHAHPFIRYKTADVATLPVADNCPECGRNYYPVLADVEGRLQDFVVTPEGVSLCACVMTFPFKHRRAIGRVQIVQEAFDRVTLRAAPVSGDAMGLFETELTEAHAGLQQILGAGVTVRREMISPEECAGPGKFRFIISHLPREVRCYDGSTAL
jgi:phenylacetate-CoA ligase